MKKRLLTILICTALILQCTACGSSGNTETVQVTAETETTPQNDHSGIYGTAGEVSAYDTENSNYTLTVNAGKPVHEISDTLFGIFIEDINFAADGGLYAEMVQNRSFEFTKLASGNERHAWSDVGSITAAVRSEGGLNENNPNYMSLENSSGERAGIANKGFLDGMAVTEGASYDVSAYIRGIDGYTGAVYFGITVDGETVAEEAVPSVTDEWHRYSVTLTSPVTADRNVKLQVLMDSGKLDIDFVSMFPQDTYKGRKNGLRKDLAEKLEALEPKFLRFPGGCVVEGNTLELAYDWKDSIGVGSDGEPLVFGGVYGNIAARKQGQNIWTNEGTDNDPNPSYMSYGLGFYEYFLLAEDLGALPVPVLNCGMHCMAQGHGSEPAVGSEAFRAYIQDALDLVEFCRGDLSTKWGAVRITMGHPEPFELKYVGIGNENWGDTFFEKYRAFAEAFMQAKKENPDMYGDIRLIFTAGPDDGDSGHGMYMSAYKYAKEELDNGDFDSITDFAGLIDHHYYNAPEWFLEHSDYYDESNYSRDTDSMKTSPYGGGIPVFLGEYAAQSNNMKAALAEAAYMTGLERNGDIVELAAYAPLFGNLTATHWAPDLIWFNNHTVT
ncbi:MAG: carbohydrate binding domain-containing protein [Ruminiclostridium sp.]|nr:carbohydrate binding domain-containing protein [Ruminiclostridium sp.]